MESTAQPEQTADGSLTLHSERYGESYASRHGALSQSRRVFLEGSATDLHPSPRVLELGFGLGLNFRTTLNSAASRGAALEYRAFELYPLAASRLAEVAQGETQPLWLALLRAWDAGAAAGQLELTDGLHRLHIIFADASAAALPGNWASAVYLDGFSPAKNPELWTPQLLLRLAGSLAPGGVLATYSAAGAVRRGLTAAGLKVKKQRGLAGKREFVVARNP